jgi:hypothetical protein
MKPQYRILIIVVVGTIAQMFLPWWTSPIVAALVEGIFGSKKFLSFLIGFYGIALPWMIGALIIDLKNNSILSDRVLTMFQFPQWPLLIIIITGLIGGISGGLAAWAGGHVHSLFGDDIEG